MVPVAWPSQTLTGWCVLAMYSVRRHDCLAEEGGEDTLGIGRDEQGFAALPLWRTIRLPFLPPSSPGQCLPISIDGCAHPVVACGGQAHAS
jgi:hypothetical protein